MFGQFSIKSDAFSFNELILEIVRGKKITCFCNGENMEYLPNYVSLIIKKKNGNLNNYFFKIMCSH